MRAVCFVNTAPPHDCLRVMWGSQEQFHAGLRPSQGSGTVSWPGARPWPYSMTFEVPANAVRASLLFGEHRVPLDLRGDPSLALDSRQPSPAPTPMASADAPLGTEGYFLGQGYGIAVAGLSRQPNESLPGWTTAVLDIGVIEYAEDQGFSPVIRVETDAEATCFLGEMSRDCVRLLWGGR